MQRIMYLDGQFIPAGRRKLEAFAPWLLTGQGVFETMRAYHARVILLDEHLRRLQNGLKALRITSPYTPGHYKETIRQALKHNALKHSIVRLTVWRHRNRTHVAVIVLPADKPSARRGWKISVLKGRIKPKGAPQVKSIDYGFYIKAYRSAAGRGFNESLILNKEGFIAEASRSNIFFVKDRKLFTPHPDCGCLDGIVRRKVLKIAREMRLPIRQSNLTLDSLLEADEAFMTNSGTGIMPVISVGKSTIGRGRPGKITGRIERQFRKQTGQRL